MESLKDLISKSNNNKIERLIGQYNENFAVQTWKNIISEYVEPVIIKSDLKKAWSSIIRWCFADERCDLDLLKGIGLMGCTGSGKTITMHVLNDFIAIDQIKYKKGNDLVHLKYKFESALYIASEYAQKGDIAIHKYSNYANLCIDDLGAENTEKSYFGNKVNVIQEIIENRYANNLMTHFTSNLNMDLIREMYGDRVYSRLHDSCNIIIMNDCDFRIK